MPSSHPCKLRNEGLTHTRIMGAQTYIGTALTADSAVMGCFLLVTQLDLSRAFGNDKRHTIVSCMR